MLSARASSWRQPCAALDPSGAQPPFRHLHPPAAPPRCQAHTTPIHQMSDHAVCPGQVESRERQLSHQHDNATVLWPQANHQGQLSAQLLYGILLIEDDDTTARRDHTKQRSSMTAHAYSDVTPCDARSCESQHAIEQTLTSRQKHSQACCDASERSHDQHQPSAASAPGLTRAIQTARHTDSCESSSAPFYWLRNDEKPSSVPTAATAKSTSTCSSPSIETQSAQPPDSAEQHAESRSPIEAKQATPRAAALYAQSPTSPQPQPIHQTRD